MSEKLADNHGENIDAVDEASLKWDELKNVEFAGESAYRKAEKLLNHDLFNPFYDPVLVDDNYGTVNGYPILRDAPECAAEGYGVEECMKVCDNKLQSAGITTAAENEKLYNMVDEILFEEEQDGLEEEKDGRVACVRKMKQTLDMLLMSTEEYGDGEVQALDSVANHKIAKETKVYLRKFEAGKLTEEYKKEYADKVGILLETRDFLRDQRKWMRDHSEESEGLGDEAPTEHGEVDKKEPVSYHFERGLVDDAATITVGQEIPDDWFMPRIIGHAPDDGSFGMQINRPAKIEDYLSGALNIEFNKLSEDERRHYDYPALAEIIEEEARRTKKVPDIDKIIKQNRSVDAR